LNEVSKLGKIAQVVLGRRPLPASGAVSHVQVEQLAEEARPVGSRSPPQVVPDPGPGARLPGRLEGVAHLIDAEGHRRRRPRAAGRGRVAHTAPSWPQRVRITCSLRSTVRGTQPRFAAISSLVYPSIFHTATDRSSALPSRASSR